MKTLKEIYNKTARQEPGWADKGGSVHSYIEEYYESNLTAYRDTKNKIEYKPWSYYIRPYQKQK